MRSIEKKKANAFLSLDIIMAKYWDPFKKDNWQWNVFIQDLALFATKSYLHNQIVESIWLQQLSLWLCHHIVFLFWKLFIDEMLIDLVKKTMELYVTSTLSKCLLATTTFDLWMSMGAYDFFALVVNFINVD